MDRSSSKASKKKAIHARNWLLLQRNLLFSLLPAECFLLRMTESMNEKSSSLACLMWEVWQIRGGVGDSWSQFNNETFWFVPFSWTSQIEDQPLQQDRPRELKLPTNWIGMDMKVGLSLPTHQAKQSKKLGYLSAYGDSSANNRTSLDGLTETDLVPIQWWSFYGFGHYPEMSWYICGAHWMMNSLSPDSYQVLHSLLS